MLLRMKKINVHKSKFIDIIAIVSPDNVIKTPVIIGFLRYPYKPPVTSFLVGLHGANVPFPILINAEIVIIRIDNPIIIIINPMKNVIRCFMKKFLSITKGIKIRTVIGRIKEDACFIMFFIMWILFYIG